MSRDTKDWRHHGFQLFPTNLLLDLPPFEPYNRVGRFVVQCVHDVQVDNSKGVDGVGLSPVLNALPLLDR